MKSNDHEGPAIAPANESSLVAEGAVTRPTGRRKYVHVARRRLERQGRRECRFCMEQKSALPPTSVDRATAPSQEPTFSLK